MATTDTAQLGQQAGGTWLGRWTPEDETSGTRQEARMADTRHHDRQSYPRIHRLVPRIGARRALARRRLPTVDHGAILARGLAGTRRRYVRIAHTFLVPLYGTRHVVTFSTLSLLIPALGWFFAVQDPTTPYRVLAAARVSGRPRRRQFLVVHALDQPVLPQASAGNSARDSSRRRKFRCHRRSVRDAVDHRHCFRRSLLGDRTFRRRRAQRPALAAERHAVYVPFILVLGLAAWLMLEACPCAPIPRAARYLQGEARLLHDAALHHDLRHLLRSGGDVSAPHPEDYAAFRGLPIRSPTRSSGRWSARLRESSRTALRSRRRRTRHPLVGHRHARLRHRDHILHGSDLGDQFPISSRRCSGCSFLPASAMHRPSSRCR